MEREKIIEIGLRREAKELILEFFDLKVGLYLTSELEIAKKSALLCIDKQIELLENIYVENSIEIIKELSQLKKYVKES